MSEPTFRRSVRFQKGYNYLHEQGPSRRGQHGMEITFMLNGPHGAVLFALSTMWTPLGEVDEEYRTAEGYSRESVHIDTWQDGGRSHPMLYGRKFGLIRPPSGSSVAYHWRKPMYDEMYSSGSACNMVGIPECYFDASYLAGDDYLHTLINKGEAAVWRKMVGFYRDGLIMQTEYESEVKA